MALIHGHLTVVKVATDDISTYVKTSEFTRESDEHDMTTYGNGSHVVKGGLLGGKFTFSGTYDSTASTGPRAKLEPLVGTEVAVIRQPEGTGSGKPQDSFNGNLKSYVETNPVADYVTFSCEITISGAVDSTAQV